MIDWSPTPQAGSFSPAFSYHKGKRGEHHYGTGRTKDTQAIQGPREFICDARGACEQVGADCRYKPGWAVVSLY